MGLGLATLVHTPAEDVTVVPRADRPISIPDDSSLNEIATRYRRITGLDVIVTIAWRDRLERKRVLRRWGQHPDCHSHQDDPFCRRSRITHARALKKTKCLTNPKQHRCPFGKTCIYLPVYDGDNLLGACKAVFSPDLQPSVIRRSLEVLEILIENFLLKLGGNTTRDAHPGAIRPSRAHENQMHPQVRLALEQIDREFRDPDLTVDSIACRFAVNRDYLSHLFSMQVGHRMGRHILTKRIEYAKHLLESTDWQIKRIAIESGFLNTDWFSHLFHEHVGTTPTKFRLRHRRRRHR